MKGVKDRTGCRFTRLTVIQHCGAAVLPSGQKQQKWLCLCDCGSIVIVMANSLVSGNTKSCGCLNRERSSEHAKTVLRKATTKHGLSQHPLYDAWNAMMARCYDPNDKDYENYGGRGIQVCERWQDIRGYVEDLVARPEGMTLDRIDVDGSYCPDNCKWSSFREQNLNTRFNRDFPNAYPDGTSWKAIFQWRGETHYVGMFPTEALANAALQTKLKEVGWYDR